MSLRQLSRTALVLAALGPGAAATGHGRTLVDRSGPYHVEILVDGVPVPTFGHRGETYALGRMGERYTVRVRNLSGRRIEAVVSVDGRDVIDGQPANWQDKRGYLVAAGGEVEIDGWRLSQGEAAAFRFSTVARSYAALTGSAREVGVIGVAIFPEREQPAVAWWPWRGRSAPAEAGDDRRSDDLGERKSEAAPAAPSAEGQTAGARTEQSADAAARRRSGLGTAFGERVSSPIREVEFVRAASRPEAVLGLRYNDRHGLVALGIDVDRCLARDEPELRRSADPFPANDGRYAAPPPGWRQ